MTKPCCATSGGGRPTPACPVDGSPGRAVRHLTVAALTRLSVPPLQQLWLCTSPECDVVYFGDAGALLRRGDVRVVPSFKTGAEDLLCYCFEHRRRDLARDIEATGATPVLASITAQVRAGDCACAVRNPTGKCCLPEVAAAIEELRAVSRGAEP